MAPFSVLLPGVSTRSTLLILMLVSLLQAQNPPNCPLWGPVYPTATEVLTKSTAAPKAVESLRDTLNLALKNGTLSAANISFHVGVFSNDETVFDFNYVSPSAGHSLTAGVLDRNTVFRIGSVSKFITVYSLLSATGLKHLADPVTNWVPELARASFRDKVSTVRWEDVSIQALAGHMAGVRDFSMEDLSILYNASTAEALGLPALRPGDIPTCGTAGGLSACTREEFFNEFQAIHPVTSSFNMPIYSNTAFQILAYAIEGMTNKSFTEVMRSTLLGPLKLNGTYLATPPTTDGLNAIIPENQPFIPWTLDAGDATSSADGLMFSSGADLAAIGQSVLSSSLLAPHVTRQWLKPITHTPDLRLSVGMPWEIIRMHVPLARSFPSSTTGAADSSPPITRIVDLYTKNGGTGTYNSQFALSPDHGFGFSVLTAGSPPTSGPDRRFATMELINNIVTQAFVPAFEAAALEQTSKNFAGTYIAVDDNASSMTLTLAAGDGGLGLGVQKWTVGDIDLLKSYFAATQMIEVDALEDEPSLRLYPVGLRNDQQVAFRGVFDLNVTVGAFSTSETPPFGSKCAAWAEVDEPQYGNIGLDDFVFEVNESGMATAITARGARNTLYRQI